MDDIGVAGKPEEGPDRDVPSSQVPPMTAPLRYPAFRFLAGGRLVTMLGHAVAFPASSALVAQTVPAPVRRQANAINRLGTNAALIVGSSVGGLLVAAFGSGWGLAVDAATFLAGAALYSLVRVPDYRQTTAR